MDKLAESRLTLRLSETVQPFAMVSVKQVGREHDVPTDNQTCGTSVRIVRQVKLEA